MDNSAISAIVSEIKPLLLNRAPGKIYQLGSLTLAIDFGLRGSGLLLISIDPSLPRIHLIQRRVRDLEKQSTLPGPFALSLRKELSNTTVRSLEKDPADRIVRFKLTGTNELGQAKTRTLVAQLTGRSANLFLLDEADLLVQLARASTHEQIGSKYQRPPEPPEKEPRSPTSADALNEVIRSGKFESASAAADHYFTALLTQRGFDSRVSAARVALRKKISRQEKLLTELQNDLATHADAEQHKRIGDLLLANIGTAKRKGDRVTLIDYFAPDTPNIQIEIDEQSTLPQEASRRFERYSRSKRAVNQINARIETARTALAALESQQRELEEVIAARDEAALNQLSSSPAGRSEPPASAGGSKRGSRRKQDIKVPGTRRYISSDGFEILVGRAAHDNDHLTFKVARPNDLWLHAADYGGSHVVVRNNTRKDLPHRTIIEAAQLAAWFSQAKQDPKVDVHYTQRKFVSKPKGAKPGLVRMTRFKNITVEPNEAGSRS
jgi:predicted ribosome quality control (RQC) complex YloA/Tae2 family protein